MHFVLVIVPRLLVHMGAIPLAYSVPTRSRRWSREQWMLAGLFGSLTVLVATIVPGFSGAIRDTGSTVGRTTLSLPLPPLADKAANAVAGSAWQVVRVQSG